MLSTALAILGWSLFGVAVMAGLALDLVGLFGNWIILGAVGVVALVSGFDHFGGWTIPVLAVLAVAGEVLEGVASGMGAAKFGGGKGAITASIIGCLLGAAIGTPVFPIVGTVAGACAGAFIGATLYEFLMREKGAGAAMCVGVGAAAGRVAGIFLKAFVGFAMLLIAFLNL